MKVDRTCIQATQIFKWEKEQKSQETCEELERRPSKRGRVKNSSSNKVAIFSSVKTNPK